VLRSFSAALALTALLAACGDARETFAPVKQRAAIVGGEPSPYGSDDDAVLLLRTEVDAQELVCSAALVAPNLALTARHCVSHLVRGAFSCTVRGELESLDPDAGVLGLHLPPETLEFHSGPADRRELVARGREVLSTLSETICVNDIALVVLDRELDLPILPLRVDGRANLAEEVTLLGYGLDDAMYERGLVPSEDLERNRRDDLVISDVGPEAAEDATSAPPRTIVLEGPSGCLGDSGGPLLARDTRAVLGVYSVLAGSSCLQANVRHWFSHVPSFKLLVRDAFEAAGSEPVVETEAGGAAGAAGDRGGSGAPTAGGSGGAFGGADGEAGAGGHEAGEGGVAAGGEPPEAGRSNDVAEPSRPKRSSGCAVASVSSDRATLVHALTALGALALARPLRRRKRQCRPSSGSESG
jgi:hypothetical protein